MISVEKTNELGRLLYGERWVSEYVRNSKRAHDAAQINNMLSGRRKLQPWVFEELMELAKQKKIDLSQFTGNQPMNDHQRGYEWARERMEANNNDPKVFQAFYKAARETLEIFPEDDQIKGAVAYLDEFKREQSK